MFYVRSNRAFGCFTRAIILLIATVFCAYLLAVDMMPTTSLYEKEVALAKEKYDKEVALAKEKLNKNFSRAVKPVKDEEEKLLLYSWWAKYDPENLEIKEFVEKTGSVLITDMNVIRKPEFSVVMAQKIVKMYEEGKVTAKDWEQFPGESLTVRPDSRAPVKVPYKKGEEYIILPNPEDRWSEGFAGARAMSYKGIGGAMALRWLIENPEKLGETVISRVIEKQIAKAEWDSTLVIHCTFPAAGRGSIRVKVCKVVK